MENVIGVRFVAAGKIYDFQANSEIKVNDIDLYYEKHGTGKPIILIHGNQETHEIFDKLIEKLKSN